MIRNFLFHRVSPDRDLLWDPMDVNLFDKCIKYISNKYEVVLIEDLMLSDKLHLKSKFATIMFDDGYKDNILYAAPILDKYSCKASFYVVTDCIDNNALTWTHFLDYTFQFTKIDNINLDFDFLDSEFRIKQLSSKEERINYVKKFKPFLKKVTHSERMEVLKRVSETYNDVKVPDLMMNWDDLKELKRAGHYIGSHTVSHSMLGTMTDESEIKNELIKSGNKIKDNLGYFPLSISYPIGSFNGTTKRLAKESGYEIGLAVKQKIYHPKAYDNYEVPRIELYNESWWKTRLRMTGSFENIKSLIKYK